MTSLSLDTPSIIYEFITGALKEGNEEEAIRVYKESSALLSFDKKRWLCSLAAEENREASLQVFLDRASGEPYQKILYDISFYDACRQGHTNLVTKLLPLEFSFCSSKFDPSKFFTTKFVSKKRLKA